MDLDIQKNSFTEFLQIGNISVLSVAAGDAELSYPLQDTQIRADVMYCMSSLVAWLQYFVHHYKMKIVY